MLSPGSHPSVQKVPQLRPLVLGIPLALRVAQGEDPFLGTRSLLVAPSAAEGGVEIARLQSVEKRLGLQESAAALRPHQERLRAVGNRLFVGVNDQSCADLGRVPVPELDHLAELVGRVDVKERERNRTRMEGLLRQAKHDGGVFADGVEHHRAFELGDDLADDVDAFRLERPQMVERAVTPRGFNVFRVGGSCRHRQHKKKKPGVCPRAFNPSALVALTSGCLSFEQEGRWRGDPEGPGTTAQHGRTCLNISDINLLEPAFQYLTS